IFSDVTLSLFSIVLLHPLVHNVILLGVTPSYRAYLVSVPRKIMAYYSPIHSMISAYLSMIYLSEEEIFIWKIGHLVIFVCSSILNVVSLFCLIKKTPSEMVMMRNYLLLMQVTVIVNGFYMDVLFEPVLLFPAIAGICTGLLCRPGIPLTPVIGGLMLTFIWFGLAIFMCCFYRHQTLMPDSAKLGK
ncbi:hypothetical protein PENTCL1PPCAC_8588, partial [Pristionchus entomophagus]